MTSIMITQGLRRLILRSRREENVTSSKWILVRNLVVSNSVSDTGHVFVSVFWLFHPLFFCFLKLDFASSSLFLRHQKWP